MTYKLPEPAGMTDKERGYSLRQYTANQLQTEIAAAELRGAEAMRERCAAVAGMCRSGLGAEEAIKGLK